MLLTRTDWSVVQPCWLAISLKVENALLQCLGKTQVLTISLPKFNLNMMGFQVRNLLFLLVPFSGSILIFRGVLSLKPMAAAATANHTNPFATPLWRMLTGCNVCNPCRHYSSFYVLCISLLYWKVDPTCMARPSFASIFKHCAGNKVDVTTSFFLKLWCLPPFEDAT